jgi:hypothetical protein
MAGLALLLLALRADAAFGPQQIFDNVTLARVFSGASATYVQFSANLPGCNGPGGYLSPGWPLASATGAVDEARNSQMVATLLFAKASDVTMEVRYRVNSAGSGWDNCAIDAIYLH